MVTGSWGAFGRRGVLLALGTLALLGAAVALGLYLYVQSAGFQRTVARTLSSLSGGEVVLDERIRIERLFPRVRVAVPGAKLRQAAAWQGVERARLTRLSISLSPRALVSGGTAGQVDVRLAGLAVIIDRDAVPMDAALPLLPSGFSPSLAVQIDTTLRSVLALSPSLSIEEANVILRSRIAPSRHVRFEALRLDSGASTVTLSGRYGEPGAVDRRLSVRLHEIAGNADQQALSLRADVQVGAPQDARPDEAALPPQPGRAEETAEGTAQATAEETAEESAPYRASGQLQVAGNRVTLAGLDYRGPIAWLRGELQIDAGQDEVRLEGDLELRRLSLRSDMLEGREAGGRLFPYTPLSFALPSNLAADVDLQLGAIRLDATPLVSGTLAVSVAQARARVVGEQLLLLGGDSDLSFELETAFRGFLEMDLSLEADAIQLERLRSRTDASPMLSQGRADLLVSLQGSGPSPGHVAASLDGYVTAAVDDALINRTYSTLIDRGIIRWGADKLISLSGRSDTATTRLSDPLRIRCAALRFYVNDGRVEASNGGVFELPENTLFSSGFIDFSDESLGFAFRSRTRSLFDWSALSFVKYAEIRGSLSEPLVTLNTAELAKQGLRSASSIVWGPLPGLVYSLAESGIRNRQNMRCDPSIR